MKILESSIGRYLGLTTLLPRRAIYLANESQPKVTAMLFLPNQLQPPENGKDHWVQLSPFGDFANQAGAARVIQRFRKEDAEHICNEFNGTLRKITQPLGMPFYVGHPDHPRFKGQPGHTDTRSYGRGVEMAVRHAANCATCKSFANGADVAPCPEHGLFVRMNWNEDGQHLIANQSYHGHSVNWAAVQDGAENNVPIYRPIRVKSAGFTNEPNIPVKPASLANAQSDGEDSPAPAVNLPPRLKLLAGFKADDEVTMEQVLDALEKARPSEKANEAAEEAVGFFTWLKGELAKGYDNLPDCVRYAVNSLLEFQENQGKLKTIMGEALGNVRPMPARSEGIAAALGELLLVNADATMPGDDDGDKKSFISQIHDILGSDPATGKAGAITALQEKVKKAGLVEKVKNAGKSAKAAIDKHIQARQELEQHLANERKARATLAIDGLVKTGKVLTKDRDARIADLCNVEADQFDAKVIEFGNGKQVVKTQPLTKDLPRQQAKFAETERARSAQLQELLDKREREFPNETYEDRFRAVAESMEGAQLFAQMTRAGAKEE